jgi:hypothetical protein
MTDVLWGTGVVPSFEAVWLAPELVGGWRGGAGGGIMVDRRSVVVNAEFVSAADEAGNISPPP